MLIVKSSSWIATRHRCELMNADDTHNNTSMFGRLKIGTKILIVTVLISITIIAAIGIISDLSTHDAFKTEAFNKLTAVREMKGPHGFFRSPGRLKCGFCRHLK